MSVWAPTNASPGAPGVRRATPRGSFGMGATLKEDAAALASGRLPLERHVVPEGQEPPLHRPDHRRLLQLVEVRAAGRSVRSQRRCRLLLRHAGADELGAAEGSRTRERTTSPEDTLTTWERTGAEGIGRAGTTTRWALEAVERPRSCPGEMTRMDVKGPSSEGCGQATALRRPEPRPSGRPLRPARVRLPTGPLCGRRARPTLLQNLPFRCLSMP